MTLIIPHNPALGTLVEVRYHTAGLRLDDGKVIPSYGYSGVLGVGESILVSFIGKYIGATQGHLLLEFENGRKVAINRPSIVEVRGVAG